MKYTPVLLLCTLLLCGCASREVEAPAVTTQESNVTTEAATTTAAAATAASTTARTTTTASETTTTTEAPTEPVILTGQEVLGVYQTITQRDFITDTNVTLTAPDTLIDTGTVGACEAVISWERDGVSGETAVQYRVQDTTAPVVLNAGAQPYVQAGTAFDLGSIVGVADNYDPAPVLSYEGWVDPNTVGDYPITATVTDSSGNATSWDLTVKIVNAIPKEQNNRPAVNFSDFMAAYNVPAARFGIDVSKWQGDIDFNAVRDAGCSFVLMRIGYGGSEISMDSWYQPNYQKAREAGLDVGVYFYSTATTEEQARYQADWIVGQLGGDTLPLPVAFDWESFRRFQQYGISLHQLNNVFEAFADEMAAFGYPTILYSSRDPLLNVWENRANRPVWLAHYTAQTNYAGSYCIWQQSNTGRIPGIAGDVDLNVWYTDRPF